MNYDDYTIYFHKKSGKGLPISIPLHWHEAIEITYLYDTQNSYCEVFEGNRTYEVMAGEMFVIPSNSPHAIQQKKPYKDIIAISLLFSEQYMASCVDNYDQLSVRIPSSDQLSNKQQKEMERLKKIFNKLIRSCEQPSEANRKLKQTIFVNEILFSIVSYFAVKEKKTVTFENANKQIRFINEFIKDNFSKKTIVKKLSAEMHLTATHVSRMYKKNTGKTLSSQINMIRLHEAYKLITEQRYTVEYIADFCGFSTASYFIKQFKHEFKITPKKLEQTLRKNPEA